MVFWVICRWLLGMNIDEMASPNLVITERIFTPIVAKSMIALELTLHQAFWLWVTSPPEVQVTFAAIWWYLTYILAQNLCAPEDKEFVRVLFPVCTFVFLFYILLIVGLYIR